METLFKGKNFKFERDGAVGVLNFDLEGERVNKISHEAAAELGLIIDQIQNPSQNSGIKAVLLRSLKANSFVVGADINLIKNLNDSAAATSASAEGQALFSRIEDLKIPFLVAIDGPCAGGGTELSLACKYRICSDADKTSISLPEVKLGILPGWGGTYRMPRLVGLMTALDLVLTGKSVRADKALKIGLVDLVVPKAIFVERSLELARLLADGKPLPGIRPRKIDFKEKLLTSSLGRKIVFMQARAGVMKETRGNYPAPLKILEVIEGGFGSTRDHALSLESGAFGSLWATSESKSLVNLFFMMEGAKKNTGVALTEEQVKKLPKIAELGILGAGVMGGGIAAQAASSGLRAVVKDVNMEAVAKALAHARGLYDKAVKRKRLRPADRDRRMALMRGQVDYTGFAAVDLVIEAIVENIDVKKKVLAELETKVRPDCLLASNTSSLSLTEMATALKDSSRFVGIHFFNPVDKMPLIEVITHQGSSPEATARAVAFSKALGKTPVVVKDGPGFLVNRLLMPWLNESAYCLSEGYRIDVLDKAAKKFGMPMGPAELLDEVGLDVASKVSHILHKAFGDRAKPADATDKMLEENGKSASPPRLGRKSGLGFYKWDKPGGKKLEADVEAVNRILFQGSPPKQPEYTQEALIRRMFYPMINEAAMALDEGIVARPEDVDLAMIFGTGFPPFLGGLCRYADQVGLKKIEAELDRLSQIHGARMVPSAALKKFAAGPGKFYG